MNDEKPTTVNATGGPNSLNSSDLSGLTEAIGGLDPAIPDHDPLIGTFFGDVKIVRLIAEGGMGRVYEGLQEKPCRPVAVKVMRPGYVSEKNRRRFDNEAELLGRLQHPYIGQIYSAGIRTIAGAQVPYFVMEYIADALSITKFAHKHSLTTEQRLNLFQKLCEAVAYGHERGVIHRDLKPSNILVGQICVPKVVDFGVARNIIESPEQATALTETGQVIGTIQYMSPEQLSARPSQIDMRADVYALGLILYELLTGSLPYDLRRKHIFEAADLVERYTLVSPSLVNRGVQPVVDQIVDTCLQKDRARRYASAVELVHALRSRANGQAEVEHAVYVGAGFPGGVQRASPRPQSPVLEILACPHCDRLFRTSPGVLGKTIRCRGCRKVFHLPKDTSSVPFGPPVVGLEDVRGAPSIAIACLVHGRDARLCPTCSRPFLMKPSFVGKTIRCRGCKSPFRVSATEKAAGAAASVTIAPDQLPGPQPPGHSPRPQGPPPPPAPLAAPQPSRRPTVFEDIGDILDEITPDAPVASVVRPSNAAALASAEDNPVAALIAIICGGVFALPVTQLILWWVFRKDPLKLASSLPEVIQWLVPPDMRL